MSYFNSLFNASYNGCPFAVDSAETQIGRRLAIHTYPNRDAPWPEDMGKSADEFRIEGFLLGDDVISQRDFMLLVARQSGTGILIHPTLGIKSVVLKSLRFVENKEHGRVIKLVFDFVEAGQRLFPNLLVSTFNSVFGAIGNLGDSATSDFLSQAGSVISQGASVIEKGVQTVATFTALGGAAIKTATNIFHVTASIPGSFGRYSAGSTGSGIGSIVGGAAALGSIGSQVGSLVAAGAGARAAVSSAASAVSSFMSDL
jgi:prophage DNA circulation protein